MACMKLNHVVQCVLTLVLFLLPTMNPFHFMAEGRQIAKLSDPTVRKINEEKLGKMRVVIGSKPPRCDDKRCKSCGHCEAVQVPIVPTKEFIYQNEYYFNPRPRINIIAYSRGDHISNYKPMSWKCKCGDLFFNP